MKKLRKFRMNQQCEEFAKNFNESCTARRNQQHKEFAKFRMNHALKEEINVNNLRNLERINNIEIAKFRTNHTLQGENNVKRELKQVRLLAF